MSMLSEALGGVRNSLPNVGGFTLNPENLLGFGAPVIAAPAKPKTQQEIDQEAQVKEKMDAGQAQEAGDAAAYAKYLRQLQDRPLKGWDSNPENYKGISTAELAASNAEKIRQRNSTQTTNQNARLGKMGALKGADSLRLSIENSLTNQNQLGDNAANMAWKEYASKVDERNKNFNDRLAMGNQSVENQLSRNEAVQNGWQGQLGRLGKSVVEAGSLQGAAIGGAKDLLTKGLASNNDYFRNTFGNTAVDYGNLMLDPNESVRQAQDYWTKQAGKKNPMLVDTSKPIF